MQNKTDKGKDNFSSMIGLLFILGGVVYISYGGDDGVTIGSSIAGGFSIIIGLIIVIHNS